MKKQPKSKRPLTLNTESIRTLGDQQLAQVAGGLKASAMCPPSAACTQ